MCRDCEQANLAGFDMSKWKCPKATDWVDRNIHTFTGTGNTTISFENYTTGGHWKSIICDDLAEDHDYTKGMDYLKGLIKANKGEDTMYLWQVFLVYGLGEVCSPCLPKYVIADCEENAILKSKVHGDIPDDWDTDYVTILCVSIGGVKVKPKPKEVKQV